MKFIARSGWGARAPKATTPLPSADTLVFHYSASGADEQADHGNCAARVRGIQNFHMDGRGWNDIAYSFLVCKHGYIFEGRGWNHKSAATGDANSHTIAVCFLGDDTAGKDDVTDLGRQAMVDIAQAALVKKNIRKYAGHRDFMSTACPGGEIHSFVKSQAFRDRVSPPPTPTPPKPKGYLAIFRDSKGREIKRVRRRWPRLAAVSINLLKNRVRSIEFPEIK